LNDTERAHWDIKQEEKKIAKSKKEASTLTKGKGSTDVKPRRIVRYLDEEEAAGGAESNRTSVRLL
jgi:hypothetical protein